MKLLYCSDLHGNEEHYARLAAVAEKERPDLVVLGGDLFPDDSALHPDRMGHGQPQFVLGQFRKAVGAVRAASGCRSVLVIFGNHDWSSSVTATEELAGEGLVTILDHTEEFLFEGLSFVGYSCTPPTPWFVKDFERLDMPGDRPPLLGGARWDRRFSRAISHGAATIYTGSKTMSEELSELRIPAGPWVLVAHAPPFDTYLDRSIRGDAWGSRAVLATIKEHRPMLSLHGHTHDSPAVSGEYRQDIGGTIAVNAGQTNAKLNYALIEIAVGGPGEGGNPPAGAKVIQVHHGQQS